MPQAATVAEIAPIAERVRLGQEMRARDAEQVLGLAISLNELAGYTDVVHQLLGLKMRVAKRRRNLDRRG